MNDRGGGAGRNGDTAWEINLEGLHAGKAQDEDENEDEDI